MHACEASESEMTKQKTSRLRPSQVEKHNATKGRHHCLFHWPAYMHTATIARYLPNIIRAVRICVCNCVIGLKVRKAILGGPYGQAGATKKNI